MRLIFIYEMKNGYEWATIADDQAMFDDALKKMLQEIRDTRGSYFDKIELFYHVLDMKKVIWMEGDRGWTS